jgi:hypothetical protein
VSRLNEAASAERLAQPDGISIFYLALKEPTKAAGNLDGTATALNVHRQSA